jgi:mono/diheme cytochrome c family protein
MSLFAGRLDRQARPISDGRNVAMTIRNKVVLALACAPLMLVAAPGRAQQPAGAELIAAKCGQCHTGAMWQDQRQDARAWEANLYRMVGRGALWTTDEIKQMADYLGRDFGPDVPPAAAAPAR